MVMAPYLWLFAGIWLILIRYLPLYSGGMNLLGTLIPFSLA